MIEKYRAKSDEKKIVNVTKSKNGFVTFMMNGIEIVVAENRFLKVYEKVE